MGRDTLRGFLAALMACGLNGMPVTRVYHCKPYEGCPDIASIMPQELFSLLLKHFRFASPENLPDKGEEGWHPLQNIREGINFLKQRSQLLWKAGLCNTIRNRFENGFCHT